ncbi:MAG: nuclear transport factor 2 family protein [Nevskiaceae bacterium]|jgi:hypothetical protein|nr:nuclear transport factor 2 family protein [Nevskiaceae bacterium]
MTHRNPPLAALLGVIGLFTLGVVTPALAAAPGGARAPAAAPCDRACLQAILSQYVDAVLAHEPSRLPLAENARVTDNGLQVKLGEGLWNSVTGAGGFRQDYIDTQREIAASHVMFREGANQMLHSVVLHVRDKKITGIETLNERVTPDSRWQPTMLSQPLARMNDPVSAEQRDSRPTMIRTALTYTEGLRIGSFVRAPTPFATDAYRIENGAFMAGAGCPREPCSDILRQTIIEHPDVTASIAAVDEENGTVLLWMNFGDTRSYGPGNALVTLEAFKVWGGEIHVVHAFFSTLPVSTQRGWPSSDPMPSLLEYRVQHNEDVKAIENLLVEYGRTLDQRDFAAYSRLFAKQGEWEGAQGIFKGPATIQTEMEKIFARARDIPKGNNFHVMSNFIIDVKGDRATADSMFVFHVLQGGKPVPNTAGRYRDILIREDGQWRFLRRVARGP